MQNLHPLLTPCHGLGSDLSLFSSSDNSELFAFLGTALLERVPFREDVLQYKMMVGRLVNAGHNLRKLHVHFGHDPRTMKKWGAALQSDDVEFAIRAFSGRGADGKVFPALARFVKSRYRELLEKKTRAYRQVVASEVSDYFGRQLSGETLRRLFREADREHEQPMKNKAIACVEPAVSCGNSESTRNQSPESSADLPLLPSILSDVPECPMGIHHVGMILFAVLLDIFLRGCSRNSSLYSQWIAQVLQGAVNIEQSRLVTDKDLAWFVGPVVSGTDPQRAALRSNCGLETVLDIYSANTRLLVDGPGSGDLFYYDPHAKKYTGQLKVLKGWCGSQHGTGKVMYMDAVHTESGRPCFVQHYCSYYDLRERFFMTLATFDHLFLVGTGGRRTFVLDRGIYGLDAIGRFSETGDWVLTWEKGYLDDGWREDAPFYSFRRFRSGNNAVDLRQYDFQWQCIPWKRDPSVRCFIVRATNPQKKTIEVAILCTSPVIDSERAIWAMFNRWIQENDFKNLGIYYGINQLTSYASTTYSEQSDQFKDRAVESLEHKKAASDLRNAEARLARTLLALRKAERTCGQSESEIDLLNARITNSGNHEKTGELKRERTKNRSAVSRARKRIGNLTKKIKEQEGQTDRLQKTLTAILRDTSRLNSLIEKHYQLLDIKAKATFDALRITASNMFASLISDFRPIYGNHRNDHVMLRMMTRADGFIHADKDTIYLKFWLKGRFQKKQIQSFKRFLAEVSEKTNKHFDGRTKTIRISILETSPIGLK